MRLSSVTVPTTQAILPSLFSMLLASLDKDTGGLLRADMFNLLEITLVQKSGSKNHIKKELSFTFIRILHQTKTVTQILNENTHN